MNNLLSIRVKGGYTKTMGERLKELRLNKGMTQERLSEISKVSRQTIAAIESGKTDFAKTSTLEALAKALGVSVAVFFTDTVS